MSARARRASARASGSAAGPDCRRSRVRTNDADAPCTATNE